MLLSSILLLIQLIDVQSLELTLNAGFNNLPSGLYAGFSAFNSRNEWVMIGGCEDFIKDNTFACYTNLGSHNVYIWDESSSQSFETVGTINISFINPGNGVPFPIINDIMYIPWGNDMYQYDTIQRILMPYDNNDTSIKIPIPVLFSCSVYDKIENKIYILGGGDWDSSEQRTFSTVQIYDVNTNTWMDYKNAMPMPFALYGGSCSLIEDNIYYFGGRDSAGLIVTSILKYEIGNNIWTTLDAVLGEETYGTRVIAVNDTNILIVGGAKIKWQHFIADELYYGQNTIYLFQTTDESITTVAQLNTNRFAPQIGLIDGRIYIAGGLEINSGNMRVLSDTEMSLQKFNNDMRNDIIITTQHGSDVHTTQSNSSDRDQITSTKAIASPNNQVTSPNSNSYTTIMRTSVDIDSISNMSQSESYSNIINMNMLAVFAAVSVTIFLVSMIMLIKNTCPRVRNIVGRGGWRVVWNAFGSVEKAALILEIFDFITDCVYGIDLIMEHRTINTLQIFGWVSIITSIIGLGVFVFKMSVVRKTFKNYANHVAEFHRLSSENNINENDDDNDELRNIAKLICSKKADLVYLDLVTVSLEDWVQLFIILSAKYYFDEWTSIALWTVIVTGISLFWKVIFKPIGLYCGLCDPLDNTNESGNNDAGDNYSVVDMNNNDNDNDDDDDDAKYSDGIDDNDDDVMTLSTKSMMMKPDI